MSPSNLLLVLYLLFGATSACAPFPSTASSPYVFLVTTTAELPPVLANLQSLLGSGSTHPCIILSGGGADLRRLLKPVTRTFGVRIVEIPEDMQGKYGELRKRSAGQVQTGGEAIGGDNLVLFPHVTPQKEFYALHVWLLDPSLYSRVVFLGHDAHLMTHVDELFDLQSDFAAPYDFFVPSVFNPNLLVVRPDPAVHRRIIEKGLEVPALQPALTVDELLYSSVHDKVLGRISFDGTLRGFLNFIFPTWLVGPPEARLHPRYGADFASKCTFEPSWLEIGPKKVVFFGHCVPQDPSVAPSRKELDAVMDNKYVKHYKATLQQATEALKQRA